MVTSGFFYPTQPSHMPTTWPIALQNTHDAAQSPYPHAFVSHHGPSYTIPHYPSDSPVVARPGNSTFEVCGYLHSQGRVRDNFKGKYLEYLLQNKNIDVEVAPPFQPVTDKAGYAAHGVVKINNVRSALPSVAALRCYEQTDQQSCSNMYCPEMDERY